MVRTYLDSTILINAIIGKQGEKTFFQKTLNNLIRLNHEIYIPQIVLGESFVKIVEKSENSEKKRINVNCLLEWIQKLNSDILYGIPSIRENIIETALKIKKGDNRIDYNDAVIVSHAILDKEARYLVTTDKAIHKSQAIQNKIVERDDDCCDFSIKDSIT
jgi:predicted nucleic acid-binding protein